MAQEADGRCTRSRLIVCRILIRKDRREAVFLLRLRIRK
jgi:hypothetical protein